MKFSVYVDHGNDSLTNVLHTTSAAKAKEARDATAGDKVVVYSSEGPLTDADLDELAAQNYFYR